MNKHYLRYFLINLLCVAVGTVLSVAYAGIPVWPAAAFTFAVAWVCNEVWYIATWITSLVFAGRQLLKTKAVNVEAPKKAGVLTASLMLVVPHAIFAVLYFGNLALSNQLAEALHLPLTNGLFGCTYVAVLLLWCLSLRGSVAPLSIELLRIALLEPEMQLMRSPENVAVEEPKQAAANESQCSVDVDMVASPRVDAKLPNIPSMPIHLQLKDLHSELLYYGRPNLNVTNAYVRQNRNLGIAFTVLAPILALMAFKIYPLYALGSIVPGILALAFGWAAYRLLRIPELWKNRLSRAEFAFTKKKIFIAEGNELRDFDLDSGLRMVYEEVSGDIATIYFDHVNLHKNPVGKLMTKIGFVDDTSSFRFDAPLQGFHQIDNAAQVYMLLQKCKDENK